MTLAGTPPHSSCEKNDRIRCAGFRSVLYVFGAAAAGQEDARLLRNIYRISSRDHPTLVQHHHLIIKGVATGTYAIASFRGIYRANAAGRVEATAAYFLFQTDYVIYSKAAATSTRGLAEQTPVICTQLGYVCAPIEILLECVSV